VTILAGHCSPSVKTFCKPRLHTISRACIRSQANPQYYRPRDFGWPGGRAAWTDERRPDVAGRRCGALLGWVWPAQGAAADHRPLARGDAC